ncbi:SMP-30/gluconolactonase/LRE family protein [Massilia cavernae]|uniref:SMP-30/gluconolactonase/LRE family protein n=1 Tax=Massilia cavernae TaxID=2320864 RepID=A0A418Y4N8_9BURK|nr:SMP-30/gluconolactonase/LRE family protein [Massilia cavernae]RJG20884.1 SMP-30/gluconolactonase/LRE family protein [Massilia cavernae]
MRLTFERIGPARCVVGESPVWSVAEQAWYWVDIVARTIWRLDASTGVASNWIADEMVACLAPKESGGLITGMESGLFSLALEEGGAVNHQRLARPAELGAGMRFNDGRCDRQGRFWSGTMFMDMAAARPNGKLYRYSAEEGLSQAFVEQLLTQNGLAFSPDGRTMYLSDSHPLRQRVWAFDYDTGTGTPSGQRLFVDMRAYPGRPDGAAIDSDGCYWVCGNDDGCILRFTPDGRLDRKLELPMAKPSMCSFGGPGLDTLLVTSISAGQDPADPWAGATILVRPGATGIAETPFRG